LANALLFRRQSRCSRGPESAGGRPGIVHRLDKDTSGVIIAAYDDEALAFLANQFKARTAHKSYAALVMGTPGESSGRIEGPMARDPRDRKKFALSAVRGKPSLTLYRVVKSWGSHSILLLRPKTGRTHQLRVHLRHLGHPILGDPLYGRADARFPRAALMLHAKSLAILLPGEECFRTFASALPPRFREIMRALDAERHGK
jgi:23S rRNA pseudouridine1911/1915/1917 synthase